MTDRFQFLQNNDIVPAWEPQLVDGAAASDISVVVSMKNADRIGFLFNVGAIVDGYTGTLHFESCSGVDGSDSTTIEPTYFREKENDGSDTWGAVQTITDGVFDINTGDDHIDDSDSNTAIWFEFEGQEIWQEGFDATGVDTQDCIRAILTTTNADGSDITIAGNWILHPLRYSTGAATSHDNRTD